MKKDWGQKSRAYQWTIQMLLQKQRQHQQANHQTENLQIRWTLRRIVEAPARHKILQTRCKVVSIGESVVWFGAHLGKWTV